MLIWPLGTLTGAAVGKLLPAPETIGLDAVFPAILLALVIPAFKNRTTLIRAASGAALGACRRTVCAHQAAGAAFAVRFTVEEKIMGNMTLFIAGIAILSLGTYLMRLGGAEARQSAGIFRALAGRCFPMRRRCCFFRRPGHHFL